MRKEFKEEEVPYDYESTQNDHNSLLQDDPSPQEANQRGPDLPNDVKQRPPPKREKNERFQDLDNTGRWGSISRKDKGIVAGVFLTIVAAVVAAVVVTSGRNSPPAPAPRTPSPTPAPTIPPDVPADIQFPVIMAAIGSNPYLSISDLSNDLTYYQDSGNRASAKNELEKAMFWSIIDDPLQPSADSPWLVPRFALAAIYFATGGNKWKVSDKWLTIASACEWHGVYCDRFDETVNELDLPGNNVIGSIPPVINMLSNLLGVTFSSNELTGTVPWLALGSIPSLSYLSLNDNQLNGTISGDVRANGVLCEYMLISCLVVTLCPWTVPLTAFTTATHVIAASLLLQKNLFTGEWPRSGLCSGSDPLLTKWSLDCEEIDMDKCRCCQGDLGTNCF